ncbi:MAG: rhodanese-related sulfurtransferase [Vicingaceae bacterium]|jgi:rhodanese-related sulfurtransferase
MGFFQQLKEQIFGTPVDYRALIANGAVVIDVRSPQEFQSGHAKGSKNIPLQNLNGKINQLKGKEVIVVCKSGMRAGQAKNTLLKNGITCHNAGAWQSVRQ